jgi:hypothetical protein
MTFFSKDFHKVSIENMAIAAREVFEKEITEMSYDFESVAAAPTTSTEEEKKEIFIKTEVNRKYFDSGVRAKQRGYGDMSPFYENKTADYFFKCGYAGTSFEQAQETLRSEIEQILKQDSTLSESVNELTQKVSPNDNVL